MISYLKREHIKRKLFLNNGETIIDLPFFVLGIFITMNLQENIQRIQEMMGLIEQISEVKAKASVDGLVNFFDVDNKKVYRYQLKANAFNNVFDVSVVSLNDITGVLTYINPQDDKEETEQISLDKLKNIKENVSKKEDFKNIFSFKKGLTTVEIDLIFVNEKQLQIVK